MTTDHATNAQLAQYVRDEIRLRGMTITEFAEWTGVGRASVSQLLSGKPHLPRLETLGKIACKTGVDVCVLVRMVYPSGPAPRIDADLVLQRYNMLSDAEKLQVSRFIDGLVFHKV